MDKIKLEIISICILFSLGFSTTGELEVTLPAGSPAMDYTTCQVYYLEEMVSDVDANGIFNFTPILPINHKSTLTQQKLVGNLLEFNNLSLQNISFTSFDMTGAVLWKSKIKNVEPRPQFFFLDRDYDNTAKLYFLKVKTKEKTMIFRSLYPVVGVKKQSNPHKIHSALEKKSVPNPLERLTFICAGFIPAVADVDVSITNLGKIQVSLSKPNVLLITVDDMADFAGFMKDKPSLGDGNPDAKTPHMDALAEKGVKFMNAHVQAPLCGPSRSSMLYSLYPSTTGIYLHPSTAEYNAVRSRSNTVDLVDYFNNNGYKTIGQGKVNHSNNPLDFDVGSSGSNWGPRPNPPVTYDENNLTYNDGSTRDLPGSTMTDWGYWNNYNPNGGSLDETDMTDYQVANFAINQLGQQHNSPFFMAVGMVKPHNPWINPWEYNDRYPIHQIAKPVILPTDLDDVASQIVDINTMSMMPPYDWMSETGHEDERIMGILQSYLGSVSFADDQVGRILAALDQSSYKDNTIVILVSDHGYHMGEKLRWQKQSLWRESTRIPFVVYIPNMPNTREVNTPVGLIDIYPTLLEMCGFSANDKNEGISLSSLINDPSKSLVRKTIRTTWGRGNHSLHSEQHQYIKVSKGGQDYEELYDYLKDPFEHDNLMGSTYDNIKSSMKADLPNRQDESIWRVTMESPKFDP